MAASESAARGVRQLGHTSIQRLRARKPMEVVDRVPPLEDAIVVRGRDAQADEAEVVDRRAGGPRGNVRRDRTSRRNASPISW
jgi:hypothetical protein